MATIDAVRKRITLGVWPTKSSMVTKTDHAITASNNRTNQRIRLDAACRPDRNPGRKIEHPPCSQFVARGVHGGQRYAKRTIAARSSMSIEPAISRSHRAASCR